MAAELVLFADFELDQGAYELRRKGRVVRLQRIPLDLLLLLVERRGQIVTREEILERVWGKGVFIDTESSINTAVRKIRRALDDDADAPRYVVTIPAKGYRFVAPIVIPNGESITNGELIQPHPLPDALVEAKPAVPHKYWRVGAFSVASLVVLAAALLLTWYSASRRTNPAAASSLASAPTRPLPDMPSVAVLPFANLSGDAQQEYFSDGIADQLISNLSRLPGLFVIARNSSFAYKGKPVTEHEIGRDLGVKYVLEGSLHRAADRIRIGVELVDAVSGREMWTQQYERPLKDIFTSAWFSIMSSLAAIRTRDLKQQR
jgi:TolB-like protein/DNA-binding winged helix-turn-helix (wHTH) protein